MLVVCSPELLVQWREKEINLQARPVPAQDSFLPPCLPATVTPGAMCLGLSLQPCVPWGRKPSLLATAFGLCYSCSSGYILGGIISD